MKKKWKAILGALAVLLVGGFVVAQALQGTQVEVKEMKPEEIQKSFTEDGMVKPPVELAVHPLTTARIVELKVEEGDRVEKGELLAVLEDDELHYQLEELQARLRALEGEEEKLYQEPGEAEIKSKEIAIEQARQSKDAAKRDYEKVKKLHQAGVVPEAELQQAEDLLSQARRHLQLQKEALDALKEGYDPPRGSQKIIQAQKDALASQINLVHHQLDHYRVHAPVSGIVKNLEAGTGELAGPEMPLMELFSPDVLEVEARVLTRDIFDINEGMTVGLTLEKRDTDREFSGEVVDIAAYAEKAHSPLGLEEERVKVTILPDLPDDVEISPGFELEVEFTTMELSGEMVVPNRALFTDDGDDALFVVEEGRARVRKVETGLEANHRVVINRGLSEGDLVIVEHDLKDIREGSRVEANTARGVAEQ